MGFDPYTYRPKVRPRSKTQTFTDAEEGIEITLCLREMTAPEEAQAARLAEKLCLEFLGEPDQNIAPTRQLPPMMDVEGNEIEPNLSETFIQTCAAIEAMQPPWVKKPERFDAVQIMVMRHTLPNPIRRQIDAFVAGITKKDAEPKNDSSAAEAPTKDSSAQS